MSIKNINEYSKLLPYDGTRYSPVKRPPRVGELAITLSHPRGYCVVVSEISDASATVYFLDDVPSQTRAYALSSLIPTGKTPESLLRLYEPTPQSLSDALTNERQMIDFTTLKKGGKKGTTGKSGSKKKFDLKNLSEEQKQQLANVLRMLMKEDKK